MDLGAQWSGDTRDPAPQSLHAIIDTTPAWLPVVSALDALAPNGRLVINAIRKESADHDELKHLDYARHLWKEKSVKSVANVTREDVRSILNLASRVQLAPKITHYPLEQATNALLDIKTGQIAGAAVLEINRA
jgi:propanol-preferring alcohol dehydrogenase